MANSREYYNRYEACNKKIKTLEKNISQLEKIEKSLTGDFYDEQSNVNKELDDLKEDLQKAVRHDTKFMTIASSCNSYKEKTSTADGNLSGAISSVENEIASLRAQKQTAEADRDTNLRRYREEKEAEEREERERREREYQKLLEALKNIF